MLWSAAVQGSHRLNPSYWCGEQWLHAKPALVSRFPVGPASPRPVKLLREWGHVGGQVYAGKKQFIVLQHLEVSLEASKINPSMQPKSFLDSAKANTTVSCTDTSVLNHYCAHCCCFWDTVSSNRAIELVPVPRKVLLSPARTFTCTTLQQASLFVRMHFFSCS